ncbi:MAG: hypothetical protein R2737_14565 [Candidatus Nanopelagicales bacterium]
MTLLVLDAAAVRSGITPAAAYAALQQRLRADPPRPDRPLRARYDLDGGLLLVMPDQSATYAGVKLVTVSPDNPARGLPTVQGTYVLMDAATLEPLAVLDAAELTLVRTAAVSMLAVRALAPPEDPDVVVIGSGPQAVAHALAARALLGPAEVRLVARTAASADRARALAAARGLADLRVDVGGSPAGADVVLCCTSSHVPVLASADVPDRAVVVAMGAHTPDAREVGTDLVDRSYVAVESRAAAAAESGDVRLAAAELGREVVAAELGEVVRGEAAVPPDRPRLFVSLGEAWEDLAVASVLAPG